MDISQHKKFYQKSPKARYLKFRSDADSISSKLDFSRMSKVPIDAKDCYCINDQNNLKLRLLESESDVIYVSEGLIKTYPTEKFIKFVKDFISKNANDRLKHLRFCDVDSTDSSVQEINGYVAQAPEVDGISPMVSFTVVFGQDDDDAQAFLSKLVNIAYVYGYSFTSVDSYEHDLMPEVVVKMIQFEAKYNACMFEFADVLVHVAPLKCLPKILRHGLVPYAKSREFKYGDRVYLFNRCSKDLTLQYGTYKMNECGDTGFCIFKIDAAKLQNDLQYKSGKLRFYVDPSFDFIGAKDVPAIFTYGNIRKELLGDTYLKCEQVDGSLVTTVEQIRNVKTIG